MRATFYSFHCCMNMTNYEICLFAIGLDINVLPNYESGDG